MERLRRATIRKAVKLFAKENLISKVLIIKDIGSKNIEISFTMSGIKEALNQPHKYYDKKNLAIYDVVNLIETGVYKKFEYDIKNKSRGFYYLEIEINDEKSYIVLKENFSGNIIFYSIVDAIKE